MKRILILLTAFIAMAMTVACNSCRKEKRNNAPSVEEMIATDIVFMDNHYGGSYVWYETAITLKDELDSKYCDGSVEGLTNVFQVVETEDSTSFSSTVITIKHQGSIVDMRAEEGLWIEDFPVDMKEVKATYAQAFEKMMESNYPKPHSKNCTIRKPVGANDCNVQYIFGNLHTTLFVDAVTLKVRATNPAFDFDLTNTDDGR